MLISYNLIVEWSKGGSILKPFSLILINQTQRNTNIWSKKSMFVSFISGLMPAHCSVLTQVGGSSCWLVGMLQVCRLVFLSICSWVQILRSILKCKPMWTIVDPCEICELFLLPNRWMLNPHWLINWHMTRPDYGTKWPWLDLTLSGWLWHDMTIGIQCSLRTFVKMLTCM